MFPPVIDNFDNFDNFDRFALCGWMPFYAPVGKGLANSARIGPVGIGMCIDLGMHMYADM